MQEEIPRDPIEEEALERLREQYRQEQAALQEGMAAIRRQLEDAERAAKERLEAIEAQANEIKTRQARRREERRIEEEKNKSLTLTVLGIVDHKTVYFQSDWMRQDVLAILRDIPGRTYSHGKNYIPIGEWVGFVEKLEQCPNVTLAYYRPEIEERVTELTTAPTWRLDLTHDRRIRAKPRIDQDRYLFSKAVVGSEWNWDDYAWYTPETEAWRISQLLENPEFEGAEFSTEIQLLIVEQLAKRTRLDKVALKLENEERADPEYHVNLNGNTLRRFQELSLEFIDIAEGRVLLAHEMGLGKTWIAIAYALFKELKQVVIVCPASLKPNWEAEITKLTGEAPCVLSGRYPSKWDLEWLLEKKPRFIIINYDIVGARLEIPAGEESKGKKNAFLWAETLNMLQPDLFVLDEVHYIKNTSSYRSQACRKLQAPHVLGLTGTPIVNRPGEYWPILHMIDPLTFKYHERFVDDYTYNGKEVKNVGQLKELLRPIMLRYTHEQVQKDLPPVNRITHYHELSEEALKAYIDVLKGVYKMLAMYDPKGKGGRESNVLNILAEITRLKQVCAADKSATTAEMALEIYDGQDDPNKKVIIFTKFKAVAYRISQLLGSSGVLCTVRKTENDFVTIPVNDRQDLVEQFQNDPDIHFMVSTIGAASEGLTMTKAWTVMFNDLEYTPKAHKQAEGRARGRLNDSHNIDSYTIISKKPDSYQGPKDTVDQWLLELLGMKEDIFQQTVEGVETSRTGDDSVAVALIKKMKEAMKYERTNG